MSGINFNTNNYKASPLSFKANEQGGLNIVTKPIDKVENIINNTVDTFVTKEETEEKKSIRKTAIRVGSTVLVLSAIVALLNPKFSSSLVNKLKTKSTKAGNKAKVDNSILGAWNKVKSKFLEGVSNFIQMINNVNSMKDELFKKLCDKSSFSKKIHQNITKGFDKISKQTVYGKHKNVSKQMNTLDDIMKHYKNRLSSDDKIIFEQKLAEIDKLQEYFSPSQTKIRLKNQEVLMQNLEKDVSAKISQAGDTLWSKIRFKQPENGMKLKDTYKFWAEEAIMPQRNKLEEEGMNVIDALVGDGKTKKGAYQEMIKLLAPHLNKEEKQAFEESVKQANRLLKKANKTECVEYFDKKRDLILGSAPTDIVTALGSLIASGIAIGIADTKEDRISRFISGALPVFAGFGISTALTALLFSGGKGMALGAASSMALSIMGSTASHKLFPKNNSDTLSAENKPAEKKEEKGEVKNA